MTAKTNSNAAVAPGSLADRVAQRRSALQEKRSVTLDVPHYKGILAAQYRPLTYQEIRGTMARAEKIRDESDSELFLAASQLILACEDVLEVTPTGEHNSLGMRWGVALAEKLGVELPDGANARQALMAIFPYDVDVVTHFAEYSQWLSDENNSVDEELAEDFTPTE